MALLPAEWNYEHFGMIAPASVYARSWLIMSLSELGRFGEAAEYAAEAIRLAEETGHAYTIGLAHRAAGTLHILKGEWATARPLLDHGSEVLQSANVALSLPVTVASSVLALAHLGEAKKAAIRLRIAQDLVDNEAMQGIERGWDRYLLGRASLLLGRIEDARQFAEQAVEFSSSQPGSAAHALRLLGDIAIHAGTFNRELGTDYYRKALEVAEARAMRPLVAHCHLSLGRLLRQTGDDGSARRHLNIATEMYDKMGMTFWLHEAELERGQLH